jgi:hypothetical protein
MSDQDDKPAEWHYEFNFHAADRPRWLRQSGMLPLPDHLPLIVCDARFINHVWARLQKQVVKCQRLSVHLMEGRASTPLKKNTEEDGLTT